MQISHEAKKNTNVLMKSKEKKNRQPTSKESISVSRLF
jgi:hypothetical protein